MDGGKKNRPFRAYSIPNGISGRTSFPFPGIHSMQNGLGFPSGTGCSHAQCPVICLYDRTGDQFRKR
jgi:hypothetical protein